MEFHIIYFLEFLFYSVVRGVSLASKSSDLLRDYEGFGNSNEEELNANHLKIQGTHEADLIEQVAGHELEKTDNKKQVDQWPSADEKVQNETMETLNRVPVQFAQEAQKKVQEITCLKKVIGDGDVELNVKNTHLNNLNKKLDALNPPNQSNSMNPPNPVEDIQSSEPDEST